MQKTETLSSGAIIFDRFDLPEQQGNMAAEVVFCFLPDNPYTPFVVWHRTKKDGGTYWGHYHTGADLDKARDYFEDRRRHYSAMRRELADYAKKLANGGTLPATGAAQ